MQRFEETKMSQELLSQIQAAIDKAAWELCEYDQDRDKISFTRGASFILPLLCEAIEQRDDAVDQWTISTIEKIEECNALDKELLDMLGEMK